MQGLGNPFPTNRAPQGGQDGERGPWTSQASLPEQSQQPAALVSLSLSSVPRLQPFLTRDLQTSGRPLAFLESPTKHAAPEQGSRGRPPSSPLLAPGSSSFQEAGPPHSGLISRLAPEGLWTAPDVNANLASPGSSPEAAGSLGWWQHQQQQLCPTLPCVSRGAKNYFAATLRCGRLENSLFRHQTKGQTSPSNLASTLCTHLPQPSSLQK